MEQVRSASRLIDVSHPIAPGMTTYPGLPGPILSDFLSRADSRARYAPGTSFLIARIDMVVNTGTYVDAPFHRFAEGTDIAGLTLERLDVDGDRLRSVWTCHVPAFSAPMRGFDLVTLKAGRIARLERAWIHLKRDIWIRNIRPIWLTSLRGRPRMTVSR